MSVCPDKLKKIYQKLQSLGIDKTSITISASIPSGKGGQKMQKTHSAVRIQCSHLGIEACCSKYREKQTNIYCALCRLYDEAASLLKGVKTPQEKLEEKRRKAKQKRKGRAQKKYQKEP